MDFLPDEWSDLPANIQNATKNHHVALRLAKAKRRAAAKRAKKSRQRNRNGR